MTRVDVSRHLLNARQIAAVLTAFALPLSTSGQAIGVGILIVLCLLTLDRARIAATATQPAAFIPVLLVALILIGVTWSMSPLPVAAKAGVEPYAKFLLIPLLMACRFTPRQLLQIGVGFLVGCTVVLAISLTSILWPTGPWGFFKSPGVPFKDNAVQSACFALCAFGLAIAAINLWSVGRHRSAILSIALAVLFFGDIFLIFVSKTGIISAFALLGLLLLHAGGWRRVIVIMLPVVVLIAVVVVVAKPERLRITEIMHDVGANAASPASNTENISTASRLDFWHKAAGFVTASPLIGYGTGSIRPLYQTVEATQPSPYGSATHDPHNQILHVTLQVGIIGALLLIAMWIAHGMLFTGRDVVSLFGQAVVLQSVIGCLFNSHLASVTQGMLYCLAIGLLGAVVPAAKTALSRDPNKNFKAISA